MISCDLCGKPLEKNVEMNKCKRGAKTKHLHYFHLCAENYTKFLGRKIPYANRFYCEATKEYWGGRN